MQGKALAEWKYRRYINDYLATIKTVDDNVGRVLDYLKVNRLYENTIVIYTSDQGFFLGEHGWFDKRFMYEESYKMPLLLQYPAKLKPAEVNNQLLMNIDFAPTILDWAGIQKPKQMQGLSFASFIDTTARLRNASYYHYFEYPGEHAVKRHYGIRTEKYKLIHYYYNIDQWELFDLQKDPHEMRSVYNLPAYTVIQKELAEQLKIMQSTYNDTSITMPLSHASIFNKALHLPYTFMKQPSAKYSEMGKTTLTDGKIENPASKSSGYSENWIGFQKENLDMLLNVNKISKMHELEIRFLDLPDSWIFQPDSVEFLYTRDGNEFKVLKISEIIREERPTGGIIFHYKAKISQKGIRQIKIRAVNQGVCPKGHIGEGKPAWIFTDEVIVR